jgi:hypothetical protein
VTSCIVDSAAIYIMVVKFRNNICPPQPQLSLHRRAALSSDSNGTTRSYIAERTQTAVYIVRCLWISGASVKGDCPWLGYQLIYSPVSMYIYLWSLWYGPTDSPLTSCDGLIHLVYFFEVKSRLGLFLGRAELACGCHRKLINIVCGLPVLRIFFRSMWPLTTR